MIFFYCFFPLSYRPKRYLNKHLMAPNTKWCGRGNSASTYAELGGSSNSDVCCRRHDHCKMTVQAFQTKYNFFNIRPFTVSHCRCDRRLIFNLFNILEFLNHDFFLL